MAALAAAVSPFRPGTASPAAAPPMQGAPRARGRAQAASIGGRLRRSLAAANAEGVFAEIVAACAGGAVLTGWAIYLGAGPLLTGLVVALPQLAQIVQIPAAWTTSRLGQRRAAILLVAAQRQMSLPLVLLPFLPLGAQAREGVLLAASGVAAVLGVLGNNAWVTWMGDLVPKRIRGRYFGRRTALCTASGALAAAAAGLFLDWARPRGLTGPALAVLQAFACASGVITTVLMARQHDPRPNVHHPAPSLRRALAPLRDPAMRGFLMYLVAWNIAIGVSGSFFSLHMLKNLKMGFTLCAIHGSGVALVRVLTAPAWGALIDRLGARPVLLACSFGICGIPFIWLFPTERMLWPLVFDALIAGVLWCGHNLAMFALPLAISPRAERPYYLAIFSTLTGVAFAAATAVGGLIAKLTPERVMAFGHPLYNLQLLFALSGVLRIGAAFVGMRIREADSRAIGALWGAVAERLRSAAPIPPATPVPAPAGGTLDVRRGEPKPDTRAASV